MTNEAPLFATLRGLLSAPPSWAGWQELCEHLRRFPEGPPRETAVAYAAKHLEESWSPGWRKPLDRWGPDHPGHRLTRDHAHAQSTFPETKEIWIPPGQHTLEDPYANRERDEEEPAAMREVELAAGLWVHEQMISHR